MRRKPSEGCGNGPGLVPAWFRDPALISRCGREVNELQELGHDRQIKARRIGNCARSGPGRGVWSNRGKRWSMAGHWGSDWSGTGHLNPAKATRLSAVRGDASVACGLAAEEDVVTTNEGLEPSCAELFLGISLAREAFSSAPNFTSEWM